MAKLKKILAIDTLPITWVFGFSKTKFQQWKKGLVQQGGNKRSIFSAIEKVWIQKFPGKNGRLGAPTKLPSPPQLRSAQTQLVQGVTEITYLVHGSAHSLRNFACRGTLFHIPDRMYDPAVIERDCDCENRLDLGAEIVERPAHVFGLACLVFDQCPHIIRRLQLFF